MTLAWTTVAGWGGKKPEWGPFVVTEPRYNSACGSQRPQTEACVGGRGETAQLSHTGRARRERLSGLKGELPARVETVDRTTQRREREQGQDDGVQESHSETHPR